MSGYLLILAKWMPPTIIEHEPIFQQCKDLKLEVFSIIEEFSKAAKLLERFNGKSESLTKCLVDCWILIENIAMKFTKCFEEMDAKRFHVLVAEKFKLFKQILRKAKLQLSYVLNEFIHKIAHLYVLHGNEILHLTLKFINIYNELLLMDTKYELVKDSNDVCNNACPYLMFPLRKFSITKFLQILSSDRAEYCCHSLIDSLLETYKAHETSEEDNSSDNSSMEIYVALTKHILPPVETAPDNQRTDESAVAKNDDNITSFSKLEDLIAAEENNVLNILEAAAEMAPSLLGKEGLRKTKQGDVKLNIKMAEKVLEYYEQILWSEVGDYLEHVVLWWACSPLSARPPRSSQHLREWISSFVPTADVPRVVLSALTSLADALGVHATTTLWDQCFQQALVASKCHRPEAGQLFCNVFQELVTLCNLCEVTPDWVVGAPLDELPLVEQIPVLHRLDHSIHTTRLWTLSESRRKANSWNVKAFFAITHNDVVNCLTQLNDLRLTDHTVQINKGGLAVHVEVCAQMRAKLISEVKENRQKLKDTPAECVKCLASICTVISLANLQMIFPLARVWKLKKNGMPTSASAYVEKYLEKMLSPILKSTDDDDICNMILTLICESWLDHIYKKKISFSQWGAWQLLCDFASVSIWIQECPYITERMRKKLLKNEILRRCEGVGKLLLRCPGERLKMTSKIAPAKPENQDDEVQAQQMPAEMYVPNQEQWLELRALKRKTKFKSFCC